MSLENIIPWTGTTDDFDDLWEACEPENVPDILCTMFAQQRNHMQAYSELGHTIDPNLEGELNNRTTQAAIREFAGYTIEELCEALNHLKNKPWKRSDTPTNVEAFKEELADTWHFFIELHIIAGIDPEEIFRMYFQKTLVNIHRQQTGY